MTLQLVPLIVGAALVIWVLRQQVAIGRGREAREVAAGLEVLRTMNWADFARLVVQSFEARGFTAEAGPRKGTVQQFNALPRRLGSPPDGQVRHDRIDPRDLIGH